MNIYTNIKNIINNFINYFNNNDNDDILSNCFIRKHKKDNFLFTENKNN